MDEAILNSSEKGFTAPRKRRYRMASKVVKIIMLVTNVRMRQGAWQYNYMDPNDSYYYLVPIYRMDLIALKECDGKMTSEFIDSFEVTRFSPGIGENGRVAMIGIHEGIDIVDPDTGKTKVVSDKQIEAWIDYEVHSGPAESGAWKIYKDWLVHAGASDPTNIDAEYHYGAKGCIEVVGAGEWYKLNEEILKAACLAEYPGDRDSKLRKAANLLEIVFVSDYFNETKYKIRPSNDGTFDPQKVLEIETKFFDEQYRPGLLNGGWPARAAGSGCGGLCNLKQAFFFSSWCLGVLVVKSSLSSGSVESRILDRYWPHREAGSDMGRIDDMTENTPRGLVGPVTELSKGVPGSLEE